MSNFTEKVYISIPAILGYEDVPAIVAQTLTGNTRGTSIEDARKAHFVVQEICSNAIIHGSNEDPTKMVNIELFGLDESLVIEVSDTGKGFTPAIPNEFIATRENRYGAWLFMVQKLVDDLELHPSNTGTLVRMKIKAETTV